MHLIYRPAGWVTSLTFQAIALEPVGPRFQGNECGLSVFAGKPIKLSRGINGLDLPAVFIMPERPAVA